MFKRLKEQIALWWWLRKYHRYRKNEWLERLNHLFTKLGQLEEEDYLIEVDAFDLIECHSESAGKLSNELSSLLIHVQHRDNINTFYRNDLRTYFVQEWLESHNSKIYRTHHFIAPIFRMGKNMFESLQKHPEYAKSYYRVLETYFADVETLGVLVIRKKLGKIKGLGI